MSKIYWLYCEPGVLLLEKEVYKRKGEDWNEFCGVELEL